MGAMTVAEMKARFRIKQKVKMIGWLRANGFKVRVAPDGWPILTTEYVDQVLQGKPAPRAPREVNLDHLKGGHGQTTEASARST